MEETRLPLTDQITEQLAKDYEHGWSSDVESETLPPGLNEDVIRLIFGFDPTDGRVLGMKVLESKETPGLGDKIEKDSSFVGAVVGVLAPILGLKAGRGTGDPHEIDMITGATISSRTVIAIINERLDELAAPLQAFAGSARAAVRGEDEPGAEPGARPVDGGGA